METLNAAELAALVRRVFAPHAGDRGLALLLDLPDARLPDNPRWQQRRRMVQQWARELDSVRGETGLPVGLYLYRNARTNNADLPPAASKVPAAQVAVAAPLPASADELDEARQESFEEIFAAHTILIAATELSATAPLKLAAKRHRFRAATMPGFSAAMIPALRLDYVEINRRVSALKRLLDDAVEARLCFVVDGRTEHTLTLDLRHRSAHASGGVLQEPGTAGNLPSGEAYIVPYEGERPGDPSRSAGELPVQLGGDVVVYRIDQNRAIEVRGDSQTARDEAERLAREPSYGNLAELGLGVLDDFGLQPAGEILLDEKLGLHLAFGRSDHFGGQVGTSSFSRPDAAVHIDRVYIKSLQPRVAVPSLTLVTAGSALTLMRDGRYTVDFRSL